LSSAYEWRKRKKETEVSNWPSEPKTGNARAEKGGKIRVKKGGTKNRRHHHRGNTWGAPAVWMLTGANETERSYY